MPGSAVSSPASSSQSDAAVSGSAGSPTPSASARPHFGSGNGAASSVPGREKVTGYRSYDESELRRAHVVALLRRGNYPFPIVHAVLDELRTTGGPERVRAELAKREQELHRRSLRRLRASAALYGYLQRLQLTGQ
jgi:hypothetical protein